MSEQIVRPKMPRSETVGAMPETDEALAVRGNAESFVRLYRAHVRAVYRYLLARLGNRQDAEDVTTQVFERAWASLKRYRPSGAFKAWLFTIAQRALADYYRQHPPPTLSLDGLTQEPLDPAIGLEDGALVSEQAQKVLQVMGTLSQEQQQVIGLRFLAELRYDEIALILGKRESAVKMMAYRALTDIRRRCSDV